LAGPRAFAPHFIGDPTAHGSAARA
jgi:hypothetical protein